MCNRLGRLRMSMHACRATVRSVSWATLVIVIADWIQDANIKILGCDNCLESEQCIAAFYICQQLESLLAEVP